MNPIYQIVMAFTTMIKIEQIYITNYNGQKLILNKLSSTKEFRLVMIFCTTDPNFFNVIY